MDLGSGERIVDLLRTRTDGRPAGPYAGDLWPTYELRQGANDAIGFGEGQTAKQERQKIQTARAAGLPET